MPKKAVRYNDLTRPSVNVQTVAFPVDYDALTYREIQERAVSLGINGKQTRVALIHALQEADKA